MLMGAPGYVHTHKSSPLVSRSKSRMDMDESLMALAALAALLALLLFAILFIPCNYYYD
jgi:hypothetical protein